MNTRNTFALLLCCLGLAVVEARAETFVGLHLNSVHSPSKASHNNVNRGLFVRGDSYQVGFYVNSVNRPAPYAAYVHKVGPVDLLIGVAGGYQRKCVDATERTEARVIFETLPNGDTSKTTYPATETHTKTCMGFSRGYFTPMAGLSIKSPVSFMGATPVLFVAPGFGKSASVAHISIQWSI